MSTFLACLLAFYVGAFVGFFTASLFIVGDTDD